MEIGGSSKKGDLSLSINAIVILILAITILGLGLTFVRGLFKQAESKITEVTSASELANPPTRDNLMTTTPTQLEIRQKEVSKIIIAYFNEGPDDAKCTLYCSDQVAGATRGTCTQTGGDKTATIKFATNEINMKKDSISTWTASVKGDITATSKTGLYTFQMQCIKQDAGGTVEYQKDTTKDVIVTVTP